MLGRPAIECLPILKRIDIVKVYRNMFTGIGNISGEYKIKLTNNCHPYSLTATRRVALPLMNKVREELKRMESLDIIRKVDEPTLWCSGMVVVPKANGQVRICLDLTKLNQYVVRERHIMPSVDLSLVSVGEARVFTKLDAFWQIKLAKES